MRVNYIVEITDANGCIFEHPFTINEPPTVLVSGLSYDDISCFGFCDGQVVIQPFGGVGDFYTIIITPDGASSYPPQVLVSGVKRYIYVKIISVRGNIKFKFQMVFVRLFSTILLLWNQMRLEWTVVTNPLPCNGDVVVWSESGVLNGNYYVYEGGTGTTRFILV